ncbi:MAG TPA: M3 family peptidase, partial [Parvularculaceae bacterium]|nr:M3 family peptidase [Parvularculaceae bacterium]
MKKILLAAAGVAALTLAAACSNEQAKDASASAPAATSEAPKSDNALLAEWTGPYDGVPAFDKMDIALIKPAFEEGTKMQLAEIDAIANNPDAPNFENTIVALEATGQPLDRFFTYWGIWSN